MLVLVVRGLSNMEIAEDLMGGPGYSGVPAVAEPAYGAVR